jgi:predicted nucleic acid-binding protein
MTPVFADAFYYIAMLNSNDRFHAPAMAASRTLVRPVVTTLWVLLEVADALCVPVIRAKTHRFLRMVQSHPRTLVIMDVEPWLALYGNRPDKSWSLTDCMSFEVMTARGITDALTGDRHFSQAGFRAILDDPAKT